MLIEIILLFYCHSKPFPLRAESLIENHYIYQCQPVLALTLNKPKLYAYSFLWHILKYRPDSANKIRCAATSKNNSVFL